MEVQSFGFEEGAFPFSSPLSIYFQVVGSKFRKEIVNSVVDTQVSKLFFI